jgi:hypothetical protein
MRGPSPWLGPRFFPPVCAERFAGGSAALSLQKTFADQTWHMCPAAAARAQFADQTWHMCPAAAARAQSANQTRHMCPAAAARAQFANQTWHMCAAAAARAQSANQTWQRHLVSGPIEGVAGGSGGHLLGATAALRPLPTKVDIWTAYRPRWRAVLRRPADGPGSRHTVDVLETCRRTHPIWSWAPGSGTMDRLLDAR